MCQEKLCKYCGKTFTPNINQEYCSVKCRNKASYERSTKMNIERDGYVLVKCKECGKEEYVPKYRAKKYVCCSKECLGAYNSKKYSKKIECICPICNKVFYVKPYTFKRVNHKLCCSRECSSLYRKEWFCGKNNHQYGLRGSSNPSFENRNTTRRNNKLKEILVYVGTWYKKNNEHGRITQHRYNVELNHEQFSEDLFDEIDGWFYLKDGLEVHHKDLNHNNNDLSNLEILTKGEHRALHNKLRDVKRNEKGQFIKQI